VRDGRLTDGPGKLCAALRIDRAQNGVDLCTGGELFVEATGRVSDDAVSVTPRVGVRGDAGAIARPWRFMWRPGPQEVSGVTPTAG